MVFVQNKDDTTVMANLSSEKQKEDTTTSKEKETTIEEISDKSFYTVIYCIENYIDKDYVFVPLNIKLNRGISVDKYLVYGYFVDKDYNLIETMYLYVNLDNMNKTYSIQKLKDTNIDFETVEIENEEEDIEKKDNNSFENLFIDDTYIVKKCFTNLKINLILNYKYIYENLDEEYKKSKFSDINTFKEYISNNLEKYKQIDLIKYTKQKDDDGNTKYTFYNNYGDGYTIINVQNNVKLKIFLDNYTILTDDDISKYKKATNEKKVYTDIQNYIYMINNKDYESAYNILDDEFKKDKKFTLDTFKDYIKDKMFDYNIIKTHSDFAESDEGRFIMTIVFKDSVALASNEKELKFIITLGENADYTIAIVD